MKRFLIFQVIIRGKLNVENKKNEFKSENASGNWYYRFNLIINAVFSVPKSFIFCLRALPFKQAIKLPILISWKTKVLGVRKGIIQFEQPVQRFMVKFGFGGSVGMPATKSSIFIERGKLIFGNHVTFTEGSVLRCAGEMKFGNNFFSNKNCLFWANKRIWFGDDVLLGWNVVARDSDGHMIFHNGINGEVSKPIIIGNHTWICSESHLLKGAGLGNDCVLGYRSTLIKSFNDDNILAVGTPASIVRNNIQWERG